MTSTLLLSTHHTQECPALKWVWIWQEKFLDTGVQGCEDRTHPSLAELRGQLLGSDARPGCTERKASSPNLPICCRHPHHPGYLLPKIELLTHPESPSTALQQSKTNHKKSYYISWTFIVPLLWSGIISFKYFPFDNLFSSSRLRLCTFSQIAMAHRLHVLHMSSFRLWLFFIFVTAFKRAGVLLKKKFYFDLAVMADTFNFST